VTSFFDIHVHPPVAALLDGPLAPYVDGLEAATQRSVAPMSPDAIADYFRARRGRAMLVGWDLETAGNRRPFSSADVAELVATAPDVLSGWGAVDPAKGALAVSQVHTAAGLGLKGIAVHPAAQGMGPADRLSSAVWEAAAEHGLVCLIHTGMTRLGMGADGGAGVKLGGANPMHVDAVAARLPKLRIVLAHTGALWREEAIAVACHKANVYLCPSNAAPESWPELTDVAEGPLAERVVFGSSYPVGDPAELIVKWQSSGLPESAVGRVLEANAAALFGSAVP